MKIYLFLITIAFLFNQFVLSAQTSLKVGYIDSQILLQQYSQAKNAQEELNKMVDWWNNQIDSMKSELNNELFKYKSEINSISENEKKLRLEKLNNQKNKIDKFEFDKFDTQQGEYLQLYNKLLSPVKEQIFKAIAEVAKDERITYIFDNLQAVVLYRDSSLNVTDKVLDKLNSFKH